MAELEEVIARWKLEAQVMRRHDLKTSAGILEGCAHDVEMAAPDYLTWLSEGQAMSKGGRSKEWLRARWTELSKDGNAKLDHKHMRVYRSCAIHRSLN